MTQSASLQFYTSTYFISNVFMIIAYPLLRLFTTAGRRDLKHQDTFGFTYQNSIIYTVLVMALISYARSTSLRGFMVQFFSVGKVGVACLLFFAKYQFSIIYVLVCLVLWIITPYPKYIAPNRFIRITSVQQFDQLLQQYKNHQQIKVQKKGKIITNQQQTRSPFKYQDKWMFFIQFYADWAMPCLLSKQLWYSYSNKYSTERLKFIQVNVDKFPEIAKKFQVNSSGFSKQLPTIVIVQNGEQDVRFPPVDQNNKVGKVLKLDYKILLKFFDLQSRYLQTRQFKEITKEKQQNQKKQKQQ